jgi:tetratricopeptide (TPR) repeat protein
MQTRIVFLFVLTLSAFVPLCAQTGNDDEYKAERANAMQLYNTNNHLEALPLFEELAKRQPEDRDVLLSLAACLIDHSATMEDQGAAAKERIRARGILLKAQQLGNNSTLLQNLLQVTPEDGVVPYQADEAGKAMRAGEAAFARRDFDEAIRNYSKVLEVQPTNYSAALFMGDSYFATKKFDLAREWYDKAAKIDANRETAYRYEADMLTKNGDMESARKLAIEAVIAEPYNPITWRGLVEWARTNKLEIHRVHINVPAAPSGDDGHVNITVDPSKSPESMAAWLVYSGARINWHKEEFAKHFPNEKMYRHSLPEEAAALSTASSVLNKVTDKKKKKSEVPKDPDLALLLRLTSAEMLEPYILLSAPDEGISHDYDDYRQKNRAKLEQYMSDFIVPPTPKP